MKFFFSPIFVFVAAVSLRSTTLAQNLGLCFHAGSTCTRLPLPFSPPRGCPPPPPRCAASLCPGVPVAALRRVPGPADGRRARSRGWRKRAIDGRIQSSPVLSAGLRSPPLPPPPPPRCRRRPRQLVFRMFSPVAPLETHSPPVRRCSPDQPSPPEKKTKNNSQYRGASRLPLQPLSIPRNNFSLRRQRI